MNQFISTQLKAQILNCLLESGSRVVPLMREQLARTSLVSDVPHGMDIVRLAGNVKKERSFYLQGTGGQPDVHMAVSVFGPFEHDRSPWMIVTICSMRIVPMTSLYINSISTPFLCSCPVANQPSVRIVDLAPHIPYSPWPEWLLEEHECSINAVSKYFVPVLQEISLVSVVSPERNSFDRAQEVYDSVKTLACGGSKGTTYRAQNDTALVIGRIGSIIY